jgi:WD40 repeat protein/Tfp pilus assembly protein PilF
MTPQDYEHMWLLFEEAKQKQPTEREAFLEERCAGNSALCREVVRLLAQAEVITADFLARPILCDIGFPPPAPEHDPLIGQRVGPYQIQQRIGSGGMGVVYLGRRVEDYEQRVAIKLIRHGLQSEEVLRCFQDERQVLAALSHPHIARLLDGGSLDGQPYLVMEYIEGQPIDRYCRSHQLTIPKRLELFRTVCAAVQYAHQNLVLHRDLKPGNILVADDGAPKLLDFGIAKLLNPQAWGRPDDTTRTGGLLLTPEYASPEQIHGGKVLTTSSDVYALGVVLYELLTEHRPHEAAGEAEYEFARRVCEDEPPPPRRWRPDLPRDLEAICLKCLHKDPHQRYDSALALADDLNRFLENQPIQARLVGVLERGWLWCRRRPARAGLIAVAVVFLAMVAVGTPLLWLLRDERNAAIDARRRAERAEAESKIRSHLAQARAYRQSGQPGQRFKCLDEIAKAVALNPSPELRLALRNEVLAALALVDLRQAHVFDLPEASGMPGFDPTFERYAWPDEQGNFHVCRTDDQQQVCLLTGLGPRVEGVLFSPDGRYLGAAYGAGRGKVWDLSRPGKSRTLVGEVCRFSPDSRKVLTWVSLADGEMRVLDLASGKEEKRFKVGPGWHDFAWHPDGRQLAVSQRNGVQLWDLNTGQVQRTLFQGKNTNMVAWHPGGRFLAISAGFDGEQHIKVHDLVADRLQSDIRVPTRRITILGFSPTGDLLFSRGWDETFRLWDPLTGRQHVALEGASYFGRTMGFSCDHRLLAATKTGTEVTLWEVARTEVECDVIGPTSSGPVRWANFSPDGRLLLLGTGRRLCLWDRDAGQAVAFLPADGGAQFHPTSNSILCDGGLGLLRWPVAQEAAPPGQARRLRIGPPEFLGNAVEHRSLTLTPNGRTLAAVDFTRQCSVILDLQDKASKVRTARHRDMNWCALSPDSRWLVTGGRWSDGKGATKVWDARTGRLECDLPRDLACGDSSSLFSPDSRWLVTFLHRREFRFWKPGTWESSHAVKRQGVPTDQSMAFTPDGSLLAIARTRTLVQLIDPDTGAELADLEMPDADTISSLAFNRDGTLLAAGRGNQVVHVWDLRRLRSRLAKLGLDWDRPPYPPAPDSGTATPQPPMPLRVTVDAGDLPKKAEANRLVARAVDQVNARKYVKAVGLLRQVIRTDPRHAAAHNHLAWIRLTGPKELRDPKEAVRLARKAIEFAPEQSAYHNTLGVALCRNDQFAEAALVLKKSLKEGAGMADAFDLFFLAMCHHRLGADAKAKDCLGRAQRWFEERRSQLSPRHVEELTEFEAEARAFLQKS